MALAKDPAGRFKDVNWHLAEGAGREIRSGGAQLAILMDIRDELKELNATLRCHRVARMADAAIRIDRRLAKKVPLR